jgi:site-specific recombinase XerD
MLNNSQNTLHAWRVDLRSFAAFLTEADNHQTVTAEQLENSLSAWSQVTHKTLIAYQEWLLNHGYTIATVDRRLSTIKRYALKAKANEERDLIRQVSSISYRLARNHSANQSHQPSIHPRIGTKKAEPVMLHHEQAEALKRQEDTPQGRRDSLIMVLIIDHGLRAHEVADLQVDDIDLSREILYLSRPNTNMKQVIKLTTDALYVLRSWFDSGDCLAEGALLRASRKGGELASAGMTERAISGRVAFLGRQLQIEGLSPNDCRHYWARQAAYHEIDIDLLEEAGCWNILSYP